MDSGEEGCPVSGFFAFSEQESPKAVVGFSAVEPRQEIVLGFSVDQDEPDDSGIVSFTASAHDEAETVSGFSVTEDSPADYVAGFTVEDSK